MTDLYTQLRTGNSPAPGVPDAVRIDVNASDQQLGAGEASLRRVVTGGSVVSDTDCTIEVRSGGAAGTLLVVVPLLAGVPVPLSIFGLFSAVGESLHLVSADAAAVTGRVLTRLA